MTQIFGSLSTDSLPPGYGDESEVSTPTGGIVGGMGFADALQVAGNGPVSPFGSDATMHGLPSGEYHGKLFGEGGRFSKEGRQAAQTERQAGRISNKLDRAAEGKGTGFLGFKTREERAASSQSGSWGTSGGRSGGGGGAARFEGNGGYVWDYYPGKKAVLVSGPGGTPGQSFAAGSKTYIQVEKEWKAAGSPAPSGGGGKGGFSLGGKKKGQQQGMSGQRAANIGVGLGSFFNQALPTVAGLFGPKQDVEMMDFSNSGGSQQLAPSGPSPLLIAGGVIGLVAIIGIGIAMSGGKDDD